MINIKVNDFSSVSVTCDGFFHIHKNCVTKILQSKDRKIYLIMFDDRQMLIGVNTQDSFVSYYPIQKSNIEYPIKAVLMDLDGTTLYSEIFWIHVIEETIRFLTNNKDFSAKEEDIPFISGHSVSEHLIYCIEKYYPSCSLKDAMNIYYKVSQRELNALLNDGSNELNIKPAFYLKEFLFELIDKGIKIGLVTSGLYEKAYPEISSICLSLDMEKPEKIYNSIITAGSPLKDHCVGTLGELSSKPHPWLYLESAIVGLGIPFSERNHIIGIEDSGAGICSLCAAGIPAIAVRGGNVVKSGLSSLCTDICDNLLEIKEKYFS